MVADANAPLHTPQQSDAVRAVGSLDEERLDALENLGQSRGQRRRTELSLLSLYLLLTAALLVGFAFWRRFLHG